MKIGIADYGMSLWDGGTFDYEYRLMQLKEIGYSGIERLSPVSADDAVYRASRVRRLGMDFATCRGPNPELSIQWTAAFGKDYVWTHVTGQDLDTFCRQVNTQAEACARWGIRVALHNHMGSLVETQPQLEEFLQRCPRCNLILDTAHLAAVGGDPEEIVNKYARRLEVIHVKDWLNIKPEEKEWFNRGRFCELGAGNIGLDNISVLKAAVSEGFDGWVFVEHDMHLQDPLLDLTISMNYLRNAGFNK